MTLKNTKFLIAIPAYNEEAIIEQTLVSLDHFLKSLFEPSMYKVVVADNNSTDNTARIVKGLTDRLQNFEYLYVVRQGKGSAIRAAWEKHVNEFEVYTFMDADLATDLDALPELLRHARRGAAIGNRFHPQSNVARTPVRSFVSYMNGLIARVCLGSRIPDFPCGFKAFNAETLKQVLQNVENSTWFFDSELLYLAERTGVQITDIPVTWRDPRPRDHASRVNIVGVSLQYLKEINRLRRGVRR